MNKRIVYENPEAEGGISIVCPAPKARLQILVKAAVHEDIFADIQSVNRDTNEEVASREKIGSREVSPAEYRDETDDEFLERVAARSVPAGVSYEIIEADEAYGRRAAER